MASSTKITRDELAEEWLSSHQNWNTRRAYERDFADFTSWIDGEGLDWLDVRRTHGNQYLTRLLGESKSNETIARRLAAVRGFYGYGVDEGHFDRNPILRVRHKFDRGLASTTAGLTLEEVRQLAQTAREQSDRDFILVGLMAFCGLRVSEVVDARAENLRVTEGVRVLSFQGKGSKAGRARIPDELGEVIDRYLAGRTDGPLICPLTVSGNRPQSAVNVIDGVPIRPLSRHGAWRRFKELAEYAGLGGRFSPHSLRHTAITIALSEGTPLHVVQDFARHANPATTQRYNRARHDLSASPAPALAMAVLGAGDSRAGRPKHVA